jgi:hypothetical protein
VKSPVVAFEFDQGDAAVVFGLAHVAGEGAAGFFEAGEIPEVGEITALLRFDGLDGTVLAFEKDAGAAGLFHEREAVAIFAQAGVTLDEIVFGQAEVPGHAGDLFVRKPDLARPAAAGGATLAFVEDGHGVKKYLRATLLAGLFYFFGGSRIRNA